MNVLAILALAGTFAGHFVPDPTLESDCSIALRLAHTQLRSGQRAAEVPSLVDHSGLIISNRTSKVQTFRRVDQRAQAELASRLVKYADAGYSVTTTETVDPPAAPARTTPAPFDGGCPDCRL